MAMIFCPNCGNKISSRAKYCPRCGAPIASRPYLDNDSANKKGNSAVIIMLGIVAALLVGGVVTYFIINNSSKNHYDLESSDSSDSSDDATDTMSQDDVIAYTSHASSSSGEEEEIVQDEQEEDTRIDVVEDYPTQEPTLPSEPITDYDDPSISGNHEMSPNSRTHHHLVGYMTDNKGNHAIELDFDCIDGMVHKAVYKNVKYGGIIHMECTAFSSSNIFLEGKDGSKRFTMNLNYNDNGDFNGYSMVGSKELTVTLKANCNHN